MFDQKLFAQYLQERIIQSKKLEDVARETGISGSSICRIRNGKEPSINTLNKLCRMMQVPMETFFNQ
jgi:DNA-binding Xre family transcriptional regulator